MKRLLSSLPLDTDLAALLLRLIFGGLFIYHGYTKFLAYDQMLTMFDPIGIGAGLSVNLVIFAELFCGFFVLIGFLTRLTVIPILIVMTIAFFVAHAQQPFQERELPFAFLILSTVIFVLGSGKFSVDRFILKK